MAPFSTTDTIGAIATPPGRGALGIVRLSGPDAVRIARELAGRAEPFAPRHATLARVESVHDRPPDQVVITWYAAPHSYTGDDCVEMTAHGSPVILEGLLAAAIDRGARRAGPGEFTLRAFVNGRIDLTQAEAVADLTAAVTPRQVRAAFEQLEGRLGGEVRAIGERLFDLVARLEASLDFPDEGYHFEPPDRVALAIGQIQNDVRSLLSSSSAGCLLRRGATVVISGRPNTGKSSLFNALLRVERAIVSSAPGTTRDILIESFDLNGVPVTLVDTAGQRETPDIVEAEGVRRARAAAERADLELLVIDGSEPLAPEDETLLATANGSRVVVLSKVDRRPAWEPDARFDRAVRLSAATGDGLSELAARIESALGASADIEVPRVTNERHVHALDEASAALSRAADLASAGAPEELVIVELTAARAHVEEVTGTRTQDDVLARIFERFCVGK